MITTRGAPVTDTYCSRAWDNINLNLERWEYKVCCLTPWRQLQGGEWMDADAVVRRRMDLKDGIRHADCAKCWAAEDAGQLSDRLLWGTQRQGDGSHLAFRDGCQLVLNLGNTCDMACRYCNQYASSVWAKRLGMGSMGEAMDPHRLAELASWMDRNRSRFSSLRISGGEPSVNADFYALMGMVHPSGMDIAIETNMNASPAWFDRFRTSVQGLMADGNRVELRFSLDGIGASQEWQRQGSVWARQQSNCEGMLGLGVGLELALTLTPLTLESMCDAIAWSIQLAQRTGSRPRWTSASVVLDLFPPSPWFCSYREEIGRAIGMLGDGRIDGDDLAKQMVTWLASDALPTDGEMRDLVTELDLSTSRWGGGDWRGIYPKLARLLSNVPGHGVG